jgi:TRAP-type transport system periplasmic protein
MLSMRLLRVGVLGCFALLLSGCGGDDGDAGEAQDRDAAAGVGDADDSASGEVDTMEWDLALYVGVGDPLTAILEDFADDLRGRTDGALDITVRPAGELPYGPDEFLRRVGDGSMAMADSLGAFVGGDCRIAAIGTVPLLIRDGEEWLTAWETLESPTQDCFEEFGARALATYSWPSQNVWGRGDAPQTLDGLAGRVIRQTGPETGELLTQLGVEPVSLTTPEVAGALQRGVVDGAVTSGLSVKGAGWDDSINWGYIVNFVSAPSFILVSVDEWNSLDGVLQDALASAGEELQDRLRNELPALEQDARAELTGQGVELVEASDAEVEQITQLMEGYWSEWSADHPAEIQQAVEQVREALGR